MSETCLVVAVPSYAAETIGKRHGRQLLSGTQIIRKFPYGTGNKAKVP